MKLTYQVGKISQNNVIVLNGKEYELKPRN